MPRRALRGGATRRSRGARCALCSQAEASSPRQARRRAGAPRAAVRRARLRLRARSSSRVRRRTASRRAPSIASTASTSSWTVSSPRSRRPSRRSRISTRAHPQTSRIGSRRSSSGRTKRSVRWPCPPRCTATALSNLHRTRARACARTPARLSVSTHPRLDERLRYVAQKRADFEVKTRTYRRLHLELQSIKAAVKKFVDERNAR